MDVQKVTLSPALKGEVIDFLREYLINSGEWSPATTRASLTYFRQVLKEIDSFQDREALTAAIEARPQYLSPIRKCYMVLFENPQLAPPIGTLSLLPVLSNPRTRRVAKKRVAAVTALNRSRERLRAVAPAPYQEAFDPIDHDSLTHALAIFCAHTAQWLTEALERAGPFQCHERIPRTGDDGGVGDYGKSLLYLLAPLPLPIPFAHLIQMRGELVRQTAHYAPLERHASSEKATPELDPEAGYLFCRDYQASYGVMPYLTLDYPIQGNVFQTGYLEEQHPAYLHPFPTEAWTYIQLMQGLIPDMERATLENRGLQPRSKQELQCSLFNAAPGVTATPPQSLALLLHGFNQYAQWLVTVARLDQGTTMRPGSTALAEHNQIFMYWQAQYVKLISCVQLDQ